MDAEITILNHSGILHVRKKILLLQLFIEILDGSEYV